MRNRLMLPAIALLSGVAPASAQWTVTNLHPPGALESKCFDIDGGRQVGRVDLDAALWEGRAADWVSLYSGLGSIGTALGIHDDQQVGYLNHALGCPSTCVEAVIWQSIPGTQLTLADGAKAHAVYKDQQVGVVPGYRFIPPTARLWVGSSTTVDLHPPGAGSSEAYGVHDGRQVGGVDRRAGFWLGTAESWTELHPVGAVRSTARSVHSGQEVGFADFGGASHAGLWRGTPDSWVDLHPAGAASSVANDVFDGFQVGVANVAGADHASLWQSDAKTWEDLHAELSPGFTWSQAHGVWHDGTTLHIVGHGLNSQTGRTEALMWSRPLDTCYADCDGSGALDFFDFLCFQNLFALGDPGADCDGSGVLDFFDLLCFQNAFAAGCP